MRRKMNQTRELIKNGLPVLLSPPPRSVGSMHCSKLCANRFPHPWRLSTTYGRRMALHRGPLTRTICRPPPAVHPGS